MLSRSGMAGALEDMYRERTADWPEDQQGDVEGAVFYWRGLALDQLRDEYETEKEKYDKFIAAKG